MGGRELSIDDVILEITKREKFLRQQIPEHKDIFNDVSDAVKAIKSRQDNVSEGDKRLLYRRVCDVIFYLLHVQGESPENQKRYWMDLIRYNPTYLRFP